MPFKDGTGPLGQGSGMGRGLRRAGTNQMQQCGAGWGRGQKQGGSANGFGQRGQGRRFCLTNQEEPQRPVAGRRSNCRFRLMSNNPNL